MSATPPPGYGVYARYYQPIGGTKVAANVIGFANGPGQVASIAIGAVRSTFSGVNSPYNLAYLNDTWNWVGDYCLVNVGGVLTSSVNNVIIPGTGNFDACSPNVSWPIHKTTNLAGRRMRGRIAFPAGFLPESEVSDAGAVDNTFRTTNQTLFNQLLLAMTTAGYPMYLLHAASTLSATPAPTPVISLLADGLVGTQRKRLR